MAAEYEPGRRTGRRTDRPDGTYRSVPAPGPAPAPRGAQGPGAGTGPPVEGWMEDLHLFRPPGDPLPPGAHQVAEADTQEMELRPGGPGSWDAASTAALSMPEPLPFPGPGTGAVVRRRSRAALLLVGGLSAGVALTLVLVLPRDAATGAAPPVTGGVSSPPAAGGGAAPPVPATPSARTPDGQWQQNAHPNILTLGDSGPPVTELQNRLLRIPDVYQGGQVNGQYDQSLAEAVSRFQILNGIRGDANGVYGDATRRILESRT
ncbi:peptidoglycan-binding domain-containing protein [Streptomyces sp. NEAU-Y11]|uniref:peptidoglycan-binding domain-containing protein n=1 Tax=Streptomyces cucumeris TaxID=2962890 RepID=UPI0020C90AEC|nr:peptidoglycan-binding domain-containing protein [Streptomyces sp. NEAU-Y11]MCP9211053.1 peptidoglycan-binding protein [Streptomyces sp. NEAU-Y11]